MIRKSFIVVLSLTAAVWCVALTASAINPIETSKWKIPFVVDKWVDVRVQRGCVIITRDSTSSSRTAQADFLGDLLRPTPRQWAGISWSPNRVDLPRWTSLLALILLGTYPITTYARGPLRRYNRRRNGCCIDCGYDLTGNESGVCPECGTKVERPAES